MNSKDESQKVTLDPVDPKKPFVGLAFKIDQNKFGQLTFLRTYQGELDKQSTKYLLSSFLFFSSLSFFFLVLFPGVLKKGDQIFNARDDKKVKVPRLVRMHANQMVDIQEVSCECGEYFIILRIFFYFSFCNFPSYCFVTPQVRGGEICAMFGLDCNSGDTFSSQRNGLVLERLFLLKK